MQQKRTTKMRVTMGLSSVLLSALLSCHSVLAMAVCDCSEAGAFHSHDVQADRGLASHDHPGHSNQSTVFHAHPPDSTDDCNHPEAAETQLAPLSKRGACAHNVATVSGGWNPIVSHRASDNSGGRLFGAPYDVGRHWFVSVGTVVLRL